MDSGLRRPSAHPSAFMHLQAALLRWLRIMVLLGLAALAVGAIATEAVGVLMARSWPAAPTHIAAVVIALILAYAVVVTVALRATFHGVVSALDWITGEIEGVASRVVRDAEALLPHSETHPPHASGPEATVLLAPPTAARTAWHTSGTPEAGGAREERDGRV